jgi:NAD(P)-dependent dehydrogenase (short-subunit alcohol dehydrogenase family)
MQKNINDFTFLVHTSPQVVLLAADLHEDLVTDCDAPLRESVFNVAVTKIESKVAPNYIKMKPGGNRCRLYVAMGRFQQLWRLILAIPLEYRFIYHYQCRNRLMEVQRKRVLITGGTRGIGRATAERFLKEGAHVVINGRSEGTISAALDVLGRSENLIGVVANVGRVPDCERLVNTAITHMGGLDVLINSAGVGDTVSIEDTTEEIWDSTLDINLKGMFFLCRAALPALRKSHGNIVNIASDSGVRGEAYLVAYCASKAAVINMTKAMALELAPTIRINAVSPGWVDTDMVRRDYLDKADKPIEQEEAMLRGTPLARMASPAEIAAAVYYLTGPEAGFITGANLSIDGGTTSGTYAEL